ncbi:MAG: O-antigen ligase family protein [Bacteroidia bacterium]
MNKVITYLKKHLVFSIILFFIVVINLALLSNNSLYIAITFYGILGVALILSLIINKEIFFYITIFFIPLSFILEESAGPSISFPSELLAVILLLYLAFNFIVNGKVQIAIWKHPITILILLDFLWMIITSIVSSMPLVSFKRTLIKLLYISIYYFYSISVFKKIENISKVFVLYILGLIYPIISSFVFHNKYNFTIGAAYKMTLPFYNDHTIYGACLAFLLPFILLFILENKKFAKSFWILIIIVFIVATFLSYSRASWLSLVLIFLLYLATYFKIKMKFIALVFVCLSLVGYLSYNTIKVEFKSNKSVSNKDIGQHLESMGNVNSDASNTERLNRWYCAWQMFLDKPVFGFGPGTYQFNYGPYQIKELVTRISTYKGDKGNAHSDYLGYLCETGLIGFLIYISLVYSAMKLGLKNIYNKENQYKNLSMVLLLSLTTFFIHGFFNSFIDIDKTMMLVLCAMAGLVAIDLKNKELIKT